MENKKIGAVLCWSNGDEMTTTGFESQKAAQEQMETEYADMGTPEDDASYCEENEAYFCGEDSCIWQIFVL